ncbi:hypothetical protein Q5H93_06000 [Hymenobacter sp. ASUV-10]|uniref:Transcriptional regulator n=1 Tax=Hymenobacter aranciens TaxID=3063996 RepID=A0ABT9B7V2_9BACT|nr:hypothetical protein [Hymenobacter sp. ASUV-10]MDO7874278.1 hypothetical protein [Hymenobacter sp. ASUV-10]
MPTETTSAEVIDAFRRRLWERDNPPPLRNDAASVQQRLVEALRPLLPGSLTKRLARAARICYAFLGQGRWTSQALTTLVGGHRVSTNRTLDILLEADVLQRPAQGRSAYYELTPEGEALLLSVLAPAPAG